MFNIGPLELVVLAVVGLIVLGPDRLPGLARDAARMVRTLRDMATGARTQLRDELGPEFADVDLRNLNPRTAISRAILGDDAGAVSRFDARASMQDMLFGDPEPDAASGADTDAAAGSGPSLKKVVPPAPKPLARGEAAPFDSDAT
ncbi:MAG TPA: sec-independent translocase [Jatrophihabitantaceae bacterium]|jgi:sec-independent protein translocase protein TatB|nr:sec-independent translocase [Jatrophihabitantaceae bacterium]